MSARVDAAAVRRLVVGFVFSADHRRVLLLEKIAAGAHDGLLNGLGGKVEPGETVAAAMVREAHEEAGLATFIGEWRSFAVIEQPLGAGRLEIHCFAIVSNLLIELARAGEAEALVLAEVGHLPRRVVENVRWLVPLALDPCVAEPARVVNKA